jgi:hypothetical protein
VVFKKAASLLGDHYLEIDPGSAEGAPRPASWRRPPGWNGDQIVRVVEATSPDALLRRIDQSLPNVDAVLLSVKDLSEDMRRLVNGPIASVANRVDAWSSARRRPSRTSSSAPTGRWPGSTQIAADIRALSGTADARVKAILDNLDAASPRPAPWWRRPRTRSRPPATRCARSSTWSIR